MKSFEINDFRPLTFVSSSPSSLFFCLKSVNLLAYWHIDYLNFTFRKQIILTYKKRERKTVKCFSLSLCLLKTRHRVFLRNQLFLEVSCRDRNY